MKNLSQYDVILWSMLNNPKKKWWDARDFQSGKYFVGYEATARISELCAKYPMLIKRDMDGRFRIISINWDDKEEIEEQLERIKNIIKFKK